MRVFIQFRPGRHNQSNDPFIPAHLMQCSCVMSMGGEWVEGSIRPIRTTNTGVEIGATSYPYVNPRDVSASRQVPLSKNLSVAFKCGVDDDGAEFPVAFNPGTFQYMTQDGTRFFPESRVRRRYYDSDVLNECNKARELGQKLPVPEPFFNWMRNQHTTTRILDVGLPAGRELYTALEFGYFSGRSPIQDLQLPEIYLVTREPVEISQELLDHELLRIANSPDAALPAEFLPYNCVALTDGLVDDSGEDGSELLRMDICGVLIQDEPGKGLSPTWVATDKSVSIFFPRGKRYGNTNSTSGLINGKLNFYSNDDLDTGMVVAQNAVLHPFVRVARVIPVGNYKTNEDLRARIGDVAYAWCQEQVKKLMCPEIRGVTGVSLRLIKTLPRGTQASNFFMSSAPFSRLMHLTGPDVLVSSSNPYWSKFPAIRFNFFHHPFIDNQLQEIERRQEQRRQRKESRQNYTPAWKRALVDKPSMLGDKIVQAREDAARVLQEKNVQLTETTKPAQGAEGDATPVAVSEDKQEGAENTEGTDGSNDSSLPR